MEPDADLSRKNRLWLGSVSMCFCASMIVWTTLYGRPDNSLHSSAQAWAFALMGGILVGFGFGAIASLIPAFKK